ncbi:MAG TPA: chemotaxis response regulator protein-glutamate methylesterase [Deltaproteobacteria bacterium]|nr:chemotaxis response regulator protein-glutamate methylesterase [Deltaproteobacteria bacterium]
MGNPIRVLIVDDSALVRQILTKGLSADPDIEVVGAAPDPYAARDMIVRLEPDVMTLDVEMPRMDGVEFLQKLMPQHPMPVVMVSSLTKRGAQITFDAMSAGAVDFVAKPSADVGRGLPAMMGELREKIHAASRANMEAWKRAKRDSAAAPRMVKTQRALAESTDKIIAIGASTGGTEAVASVIRSFPPDMPGVVIVQHMPAGYTKRFAARLDELCAMQVKEAEAGDRVQAGRILLAPGDHHLRVVRHGGVYRVELGDEDRVCGHRPSVEVLFESVAREVGPNAVGIILTGMGHDGAGGLLAMREAGAHTVAQDEATSVVFGMPKVAIEKGGAERVAPLDRIASIAAEFLG